MKDGKRKDMIGRKSRPDTWAGTNRRLAVRLRILGGSFQSPDGSNSWHEISIGSRHFIIGSDDDKMVDA